MKLIRKKVVDAKTSKVPVVDYNTYGLRPMATIGSKLTNPPFNESGDSISLENFRNKDPQGAHDKIPQLYFSSKTTGHNPSLSVSSPTIFETAYRSEFNI